MTLSPGQAMYVAQGNAGGDFTPATFARDVLQALDAPLSADNMAFLEGWERAEGGNWHNTARYNPLNTTLHAQGSVNFQTGAPGAGVQAYPDAATGEAATVSTLTEKPYVDVVAALRHNDQAAAATAVVQSPWDEAHYGWSPRHLWPSAPASVDASAPSGDTSSSSSSSTSSSATGTTAGLNWNPLDGFGLFSSAKKDIAKVAINVTFLAAGLALVVLGVYKTADPNGSVKQTVTDVGKTAAMAAAA